ncbi:MAG: hypothetical protein EBQ92_11030 [Proteobacteria bacterium]|nr:hypothetical protein [Pseudomonadota bacterium]
MSKLFFQADLPASQNKDLRAKISKELRSARRSLKKSQQEEMHYHPGRVSPLDYLVFKILHSQFGEKSQRVFPIASRLIGKLFSR